MAQTVSVSLYTLRITERHKSTPQVVSNFAGGADLLTQISDALTQYQGNSPSLKGGTRRVYITNDLATNGRILDGTAEVGESGFTASIKEIATGKENYRQKVTEAAMIPLYYRFWIPKGQHYGFAAFQHFGDAGCKTALETIISSHFNDNHSNFTLRFRQRIPDDYADEVIKNAGIKELRFIQFGVTADIADMYGGSSLPPGTANTEVRIVAQRNNTLGVTQLIKNAIRGQMNPSKGFELDSFQSNDFRMTVTTGGTVFFALEQSLR